MVIESGRALVLAYNKWDLTDEERRKYLAREIDRDLVQVPWAPSVNISAKTKRHVDKIGGALEAALEGWETRVSTGRLNAFIKELTDAHPHPLRGGRQPRILFAAQVQVAPPTFALFTTGFLEAGYRRFIERRLREDFGFDGHAHPPGHARAGEAVASTLIGRFVAACPPHARRVGGIRFCRLVPERSGPTGCSAAW